MKISKNFPQIVTFTSYQMDSIQMETFLRIFLAVLLTSCSVANPVFVIDAAEDEYGGYRLPQNNKPSRYLIHLEVKKDVFEGDSTVFNGTVVINFNAISASNNIKLHAPVEINSLYLEANGNSVPVTDYSLYNTTTNILTITTGVLLDITLDYTLTIRYTGILSTTSMTGFYRSEYEDANGVTQYLVTSKFEPTHARFAFPCFDEPLFKAKFVVVVTYPKGLNLNALSNTPQNGEPVSVNDEDETVTFNETPVMSTYLVAFIVSKFTCTAGEIIQNDIPYQVCSRAESALDRDRAVELGPPLMKALEDITDISYSSQLLQKMDLVAIPDFQSGAMENWGLITYRETALLWNNIESSTTYEKRVATVISHEFVHNWFGNLVTMEWWDYIFLNEGFARFYQYFAAVQVDQLKHWELEKQFVIDQVQAVLVTDGSSSVAAMTSKASSPTQISNKFSTINYAKGASILRMVEQFIGPNNFQQGIRNYLKTYASSNTNPLQLWNSLTVFTPSEALPDGVTLDMVMENWIDQPGYPVINVTLSGNDIILSQERFLYSGSRDTQWYVPISYTLSSDDSKFEDTSAMIWLTPDSTVTLSGLLETDGWIVFNNQQTGYYRVNYGDALGSRITQVLFSFHTSINVLNRAQIVDDLLNFARAGKIKYSEAFRVLEYLINETEYYPWYSTFTPLMSFLLPRLGENSGLGIELSHWIVRLVQKVYQTVSFSELNADDQIYTLKLVLILTNACKLKMYDCISKSKELYSKYREGISVDKNLRTIVYCNALRHSDNSTSDWQFLWEKFQNTSLASEQVTIISALGCTRNATLLKYYLEQSINSTSGIRLQDFTSVWSAVYTGSPEGIDAAFDYIYENHIRLYAYYSSAGSLLSSIVSRFTTELQLQKLESFIELEDLNESIRATARSALNSARVNLAWVVGIEDDLKYYFFGSNPGDETVTPTTSTTPGDGSDDTAKNRASITLIVFVILLCTLYL